MQNSLIKTYDKDEYLKHLLWHRMHKSTHATMSHRARILPASTSSRPLIREKEGKKERKKEREDNEYAHSSSIVDVKIRLIVFFMFFTGSLFSRSISFSKESVISIIKERF